MQRRKQAPFVRLLATTAIFVALSASPAPARSLNDIKEASFGEVGFLRRVDCPIGGRYDCLTFPHNLYRLNSDCFTLSPISAVSGYEEAMMMQFRSGEVALMVKAGFGDRFEIVDIERMYQCPNLY